MSSAHVERDIPTQGVRNSTGRVETLHEWPGYWQDTERQQQFSAARDRQAARKTNAHFDHLNRQPFGSPVDPTATPEPPITLQEPAA